MSIKPVDMQVILPKSTDVIKTNNNLSNRSDYQSQIFSEILQKKNDDKNNQINRLEKSESKKVNRDKEKYKKGKEEDERKEKKKGHKNKGSTSMYDISI